MAAVGLKATCASQVSSRGQGWQGLPGGRGTLCWQGLLLSMPWTVVASLVAQARRNSVPVHPERRPHRLPRGQVGPGVFDHGELEQAPAPASPAAASAIPAAPSSAPTPPTAAHVHVWPTAPSVVLRRRQLRPMIATGRRLHAWRGLSYSMYLCRPPPVLLLLLL